MPFNRDVSMDVPRLSPATMDALLKGVDPAGSGAPKDRTLSDRSTWSVT
jgi:hypothetical protein